MIKKFSLKNTKNQCEKILVLKTQKICVKKISVRISNLEIQKTALKQFSVKNNKNWP